MDRQIIDIVDLDIDDASKVLLVEDCLVQGGNPSDEELSKLFWLCLISLASHRPVENQIGAKIAENVNGGTQAAKFWEPVLNETQKVVETFFDLASTEVLPSTNLKVPSAASIHGLDRLLQLAQPHIKRSAAELWKQIGARLSLIISTPSFDAVRSHSLFTAIIMINGNSGRAIMPFDILHRPLLHWLALTPLKVQTYETAAPAAPQISKAFATQLEWLLKVFSMASKINKKLASQVIEEVLKQLLTSESLISPVLPLVLPNITPELEQMSLSLNELTILKVLPIILNWPMTTQVRDWTSLLILRLKYLITHKQRSKADYDKQIRNWYIMVEKAIDLLCKSLFHRKCRHAAVKILYILLNSLQRSPKAFLKALPLLKEVLVLYTLESKGLSKLPSDPPSSVASNASNNSPTSTVTTSTTQPSAKPAASSQLALPMDISSVVSYLVLVDQDSLESLMKQTDIHDSILSSTASKDPEIDETLKSLGKLLFIQMHCHRGHPEAYIPIYDHLRDYLCVDANGSPCELISSTEIELQLKADSWTFVASSAFNMFERSGSQHSPINIDDGDEMLEFSALSDDDFDASRSDLKKLLGIAGLVNLGNTCYLNSVIQVLNQTVEFRKAIFQNFDDVGTSTSLLRELQYTFAALSLTNRSSFAPRTLISTLPDWIKGGRQHDASELEKAIFDILDSHWAQTRKKLAHDASKATANSSTPLTSPEAKEKQVSPIERIFGGKVTTSVRCKVCGTFSNRTETILDLSLTFPDEAGGPHDAKKRKESDQTAPPAAPSTSSCGSVSIESLLENFMETETMEDSNQYHCSTCQKLVDAEKIQRISSAPEHLIVNLVRFRYDYKTQVRSKILTEVEFKEHLDLPVLSQPTLDLQGDQSIDDKGENRMDSDEHNNEENAEHHIGDANSGKFGIRLTSVPYTLYGCVMHSGRSAEHGHYYSYARASVSLDAASTNASPSASSSWFRFNDENVDSSSFDSFSRITKHFPADVAYILLYKRDDVPLPNQSSMGATPTESPSATTNIIPPALIKRVIDDNEKAEVERRTRKKNATRQALFSTRSRFDDSHFGGGPGLGGGPMGGTGPGGLGGLGGFGGWVS